MSIYTHPKIAARRAADEVQRKIRLAKAILNEPPGTIPASGRGQKEWARKTLKAAGRLKE